MKLRAITLAAAILSGALATPADADPLSADSSEAKREGTAASATPAPSSLARGRHAIDADRGGDYHLTPHIQRYYEASRVDRRRRKGEQPTSHPALPNR